MLTIKNTYREDRDALIDQYVIAWHNDEAFLRHDILTSRMHEYAKTCRGLAHPVIKAKCFAFLCENAPIYINEKDWFGISLEVPKLDSLFDIGSFYHRPLMDLCDVWKKKLGEQLTSKEDEEFIKKTRNYLIFILYIIITITLVEVVQLFTLLGSCDIDDLIFNTIGASIGYLIFLIIYRCTHRTVK
jgi:VanZ family protein